MERNDFTAFKQACLDVLSKSGNCEDSRKAFMESNSYQSMVFAWKKYIDGMMKEVPQYVNKAFSELYESYRLEMNRTSVFFNEPPSYESLSSLVIVGDCDARSERLSVDGMHRVYVIGNLPVSVYGECRVFVNSEKSTVSLHDTSFANVRSGKVFLHGRSSAVGRGSFTTYDASSLNAYRDSVVDDDSHSLICAYGDTLVYSNTHKKIKLYDNARLVLSGLCGDRK